MALVEPPFEVKESSATHHSDKYVMSKLPFLPHQINHIKVIIVLLAP